MEWRAINPPSILKWVACLVEFPLDTRVTHLRMEASMWMTKYTDAFASEFDSEQEYIDAAFMMIILYNFGIFVDRCEML